MEKLTIKLKHFKNAAAVGVFFNHRGALPKVENKELHKVLFFLSFQNHLTNQITAQREKNTKMGDRVEMSRFNQYRWIS